MVRFSRFLFLAYAVVLLVLIILAIVSFTGYWENDFANPAV